MAGELEKRAAGAFVDDNFELACDLYSQAIDMDPANAGFFANRAQANIKLKRYTEAVADATRAIELDPSMAKAYLRKGTACIQLEEFETAMEALKKGASLDPKNMKFHELIGECDKGIAEEVSSSCKSLVPNNHLTAVSPSLGFLSDGTNTANGHDVTHGLDGYNHTSSELSVPKPKYRHEYYQKPDQVVLTIFAKGISSEYIKIDFGEQLLSVIIEVPNEEIFCFQPRLFAKILPQRCRYTILSTKIEIRLFKADESINWISLEYKGGASTSQRLNSLSGPRPAYPSSKSKGTDWDKLEAEVKREEKDEKLDGDAALNKMFRDIYQNADEDTRRAMKKSFVESNGTVLSTNWKDVGSKTVEGSAPDGMEMKKWEY